MNKTLCALALSITALTGGCNPPIVVQPEGGKAIEIPANCVEVKSLVYSHSPQWSLTCVDKNGKDVFYHNRQGPDGWEKYDLVRK